MRLKIGIIGLTFSLLLFLTFLPSPTTTSLSGTSQKFLISSLPSQTTGYIDDVPYVWQEINGFCFWSSLSMALQYIGVPMNLYDVFVLTGLGFSMVYVQSKDLMMLVPGAAFRQLYQTQYLKAFQGIEYTILIDNTTEPGQLFADSMASWSLEFDTIEGKQEALDTLRRSIDAGYPLILGVDPYYLPVNDYDILRVLNLHSSNTGSGHAVLAIGYNDTTQKIWIMDPGVGALGEDVAYPSDGRWLYAVDYNDLSLAREAIGFMAVQIKSSPNNYSFPTHDYAPFIYQRLLGVPESYEIMNINPSIISCGANAFQHLSINLSPSSLVNYLINLKEDALILTKLYELGITLEQMLTLQYLSYRSALAHLSEFLPEYDLSKMLILGELALPHFDVLSTNVSLTTFNQTTYNSLIKDTFWGIAELYKQNQNIYESVVQFRDNLELIRIHLDGIAAAWRAAAYELKFLIKAPTNLLYFAIFISCCAIGLSSVSVVIILRKRRN
ncbi:MAG: BtrH N-terminal domain-containing protein [Candidatus Thorarchaeota archaeon]